MDTEESLHDVEGSASRAMANVLTWNINGLRKVAADHGGLEVLLNQFHADVVEHHLARAQGYHCFFSHCKVPRKQSYSGVATFVRSGSGLRTLASTSSLSDTRFFGALTHHGKGVSSDRLGEIDAEGRVLVTDHGHFVLFNIYGPCISSGDEDERTEERRVFKRDFLAMLEARILGVRERRRHVILVGDLNACVSQLDHGFTMTDKEFYSSPWSKWIRGLLGLNSADPPRLLDCFRHRHPDRKNAFTCWNTQTGARENNYGTRIDYIIADAVLVKEALETCDIMPEFLGSDHCPVKAKFALPVVPPRDQGGLAPNAAARSSVGEGTDGDGDGKRYGDGVGGLLLEEWPEHPPECSCFYVELKGKQEKLAKFLVVGASAFKESEKNGVRGEERVKVWSGSTGERRTQGNGRKRTRQSKLMFPTIPRAESKAAEVAHGYYASSASGSCWVGSDMRKATASNLSEDSTAFSRLADKEGSMLLRGSVSTCSTLSKSARENHGESRDSTERRPALASGEGKSSHGGSSKDVEVVGAADKQGEERRVHIAQCGNGAGGDGGGDDQGGSDRGASAEAWKALFNRKKSAPLCEHGEPSIQRTVIKQGANHNRRFYTCARSAGNWPTDRNARCNFFQWRLDGVRGYKDRPSQGEDSRKLRRTA